MASYVVSARLDGARPRRRDRPATVERGRPIPAIRTGAADDPDDPDDIIRPVDLVGWDRPSRIGEWWAQTTFYLFDPESWRRG